MGSAFTFPTQSQVGIHMGTGRWVGVMQIKILPQGNATTSVASHSLIIQLVQLKAMWVKFLAEGNNAICGSNQDILDHRLTPNDCYHRPTQQ